MESNKSPASGKDEIIDAGNASHQAAEMEEKRLEVSAEKYKQQCLNLKLGVQRNIAGMGVPLQTSVDLCTVRQPRNPSSSLHEQVLLGVELELTFANIYTPDEYLGI